MFSEVDDEQEGLGMGSNNGSEAGKGGQDKEWGKTTSRALHAPAKINPHWPRPQRGHSIGLFPSTGYATFNSWAHLGSHGPLVTCWPPILRPLPWPNYL